MTGKNSQDESSTEVAVPRWNDDQLRELQSFEDAFRLLSESGFTVDEAEQEIGSGFGIIENKTELLNVPILCLFWTFNMSDKVKDPETGMPKEFVSVVAIAELPGSKVPRKCIINDGSTGIYAQLRDHTARTGKDRGLFVRKGLRVSRYKNEFTDEGETFYLNV